MNCAFIISPSYSGSTMLSMLLAHHPKLVTLGEFLNTRERGSRIKDGDFCSCGEELPSCPYMTDLVSRVTAQGLEFSVDFPDLAFRSEDMLTDRVLRTYIRSPWFEFLRRVAIASFPKIRQTVDRIVHRNTTVISEILKGEGADIFLDSAKNNTRVFYFDRYAPEIEVKVIWLVRDGRGVVNSIKKHYQTDFDRALKVWQQAQISVIKSAQMLAPEQLYRVHYEDLCQDPDKYMAEISRFLGLDPALLPESFGDQEVHLTGNNMRLKGLGEIRMDEKWRTALTEEELELFARLGGKLNKELGYS